MIKVEANFNLYVSTTSERPRRDGERVLIKVQEAVRSECPELLKPPPFTKCAPPSIDLDSNSRCIEGGEAKALHLNDRSEVTECRSANEVTFENNWIDFRVSGKNTARKLES